MSDLTQHYSAHLALRIDQWRTACQRHGYAGAVIHAGSELHEFRDDRPIAFRTNPYFAALVPLLNHPNCCIVLDESPKPRLILFKEEDFWVLPPAEPEGEWLDHFHIETVASQKQLQEALPAQSGRHVAVAPQPLSGFTALNPEPVLNEIDYWRATKTPYEVSCLEAASRVGVLGHRAARAAFLSGAPEFDIHLIYCQASGQTEADLPYASIVALAPHGAVLHYQHRDRDRRDAPALLLDAGGTFLGYNSDITRTWTTDGDFQALVDAMVVLQKEVCQEARVGMSFTKLNELAHRLLAELLVEADVLRCSADEAMETHLTSKFLPHGLGHLLGIQVHDGGGTQR